MQTGNNNIIQPTKKSHRILVLILVILLTAGVIGGGVYYVLNQQMKKQDKLIEELQKETGAKKSETKTEEKKVESSVTKNDQTVYDFSNKQLIKSLTEKRTVSFSGSNILWVVFDENIKIDGSWASSIPTPLIESEQITDGGYEVVGMGGFIYYWVKNDNKWEYVGLASEGGFDDSVKARFNEIPYSIIPKDGRE